MFYLLVMEEVETWEQGDKFEFLICFSSRLLSIDTPGLLFNTISFEKKRDGLILIFLDIIFIYKFIFIKNIFPMKLLILFYF